MRKKRVIYLEENMLDEQEGAVCKYCHLKDAAPILFIAITVFSLLATLLYYFGSYIFESVDNLGRFALGIFLMLPGPLQVFTGTFMILSVAALLAIYIVYSAED